MLVYLLKSNPGRAPRGQHRAYDGGGRRIPRSTPWQRLGTRRGDEYGDFECPACAGFAVIQMPTIKEH